MNNRFYILLVFMIIITGTLSAQQKVCSLCGGNINGSFVMHGRNTYHKLCFTTNVQEKCALCEKPISGKYITVGENKYHEVCYVKQVALRCNLCGEVIEGYYITDYWGNTYHQSHENNYWKCDYCSRLISPELTGGGIKYNDGRTICSICNKTSVTNVSKAESILQSVRKSLEQYGLIINFGTIDVQLVDRDNLEMISNKNSHPTDTRGYAYQQYWTVNGIVTKRDFKIYLLHGMPQADLEEVAAHELMHIWQYLNSPENMELQLTEGSAEYAAYLYLKDRNDTYSKYLIHRIETNRNTIYSGGFKRVKTLVDRTGLDNLLEVLKQHKKFPTGY